MDILTIVLTVLGLCLFEIICSIDNAIINADVLATMGKKARRWFLLYGIIFAVFVVRGVLPLIIVWVLNPHFTLLQVFESMGDEEVARSIESTAPILFMGGGTFLVLLFLHWIFLEEKNIGLRIERQVQKIGVWFYAVASIFLAAVVWYGMKIDPMLAFAAVVGSTAFFITHGFKQNAEAQEAKLLSGTSAMSDISKILYLEIIDMTFSIDGVLGAFAFTLAIPIILLGNGLGAFVVREITIKGVTQIKKYVFLKNGAMYSILVLGAIMMADGFGIHIPEWLSPICTFLIVGFFFIKSRIYLKKGEFYV
ncbi:MAG: DUF475 domain-containing protein [Prevotellaceae bacterium]|jgi:hypothetical protein|nr:DUF475 domain-containing protein [Prevotellaceae bacterium]